MFSLYLSNHEDGIHKIVVWDGAFCCLWLRKGWVLCSEVFGILTSCPILIACICTFVNTHTYKSILVIILYTSTSTWNCTYLCCPTQGWVFCITMLCVCPWVCVFLQSFVHMLGRCTDHCKHILVLPLAEEGLSPDASGAEVSPTAGNV